MNNTLRVPDAPDGCEALVALVTGSSRGIGRAIALALARENFSIVINYVADDAAARRTAEEVESAGGRAIVCQADIARREDRALLIEHVMAAMGRIDLLVNNAGISPVRRDILEMTPESYDQVMEVNLKGTLFLTQQVARLMIDQRRRGLAGPLAIVNISSIRAYSPNLTAGEYCLSKAGMSMLTRLFAARLAEYDIGVYEVRPALIATDMAVPVKAHYDPLIAAGVLPIRRWGQPEDVARVVAGIARGHFPFSTGEMINVDGGFHLRRL